MRRGLVAIAVLLAWALVLVIGLALLLPGATAPATPPDTTADPTAVQEAGDTAVVPPALLRAPPDAWQAVMGQVKTAEERLVVTMLSEAGEAFLVWPLTAPVNAADFPVLTLEAEGIPHNYITMLAWKPDPEAEARFLRLQSPRGGRDTYWLNNHQEWRGPVIELAVYIYPQLQTTPPLPLTEPLVLSRVALSGDSLGARIRALITAWLAPDPWEMLSPSSLGDYPDSAEGLRALPALTLYLVGAIVLLGLTLGLRTRRALLRAGSTAVVAAVALCYLHWLYSLGLQHQATHQLFAEDAPGDAADYAAPGLYDRDLVELVKKASRVLTLPSEDHIYVSANARFFRLRAAWHLLPHNVLPFLPGESTYGADLIAAGDYLLLYERPGMVQQAARGHLKLAARQCAVRVLARSGNGALIQFVTNYPECPTT
ncbi:MAG: hypothetical protein AAGA23_08910 [Pseudomonadota bacterium]